MAEGGTVPDMSTEGVAGFELEVTGGAGDRSRDFALGRGVNVNPAWIMSGNLLKGDLCEGETRRNACDAARRRSTREASHRGRIDCESSEVRRELARQHQEGSAALSSGRAVAPDSNNCRGNTHPSKLVKDRRKESAGWKV
jgi:hypothetical protein